VPLQGNLNLDSFFGMAFEGKLLKEVLECGDALPHKLVSKTHVTLAHCRDTSQDAMREPFAPLVGSRVGLYATGLLWNDRVAAVAITVDDVSDLGKQIPPSRTVFSHITVFVQDGAFAAESKHLPALVESKKANSFEFKAPIRLQGTLNFWF
jgi:hypothetical protein